MRSVTIFATWCSCLVLALAATTGTATPFIPPAVPLAVRSPYLSAWLNQGKGNALNNVWPSFWSGTILGWAGFAKVDGVAYGWLGTPGLPAGVNSTKATQKSLQITSTQSIFVMTAGPVDLTITFLSPVEPADFVNQSLPFSYLAVSAASNDGQDHNVQIYSDISAEWISGDNSLEARWSTTMGDVITHTVQLDVQHAYTEVSDRIQDGSAYYSTLNPSGTASWQSGQDIVVRSQFVNKGVLANTQDPNFRAVSDDWPVFGLAHDLGAVNAASAPVVFSIGHYRDPAVQYIVANNQLQARRLAFWSRYSSANEAILAFLNDYTDALLRANAFDAQVAQDASKVSNDYASIVALSVRQTFGALEITLPTDLNTSDVLMFHKEISSDGNVNTADAIFPAWPLFCYINPTLGKQLLLPLLEYQATGQYPNDWALHDVGSNYPNATGHNNGADTPMPVEESGNMLIMVLSYTQRTNDTSLIENYYTLLDKWAQYLVRNALEPGNQFDTENWEGASANQTNLAIKGIIGIKAMSEIAAIQGDTAKASGYSSTASQYAQQWEKLATSTDGTHLTLNYGNTTSWALAYNLYADKLLGTNVFPQSVYDMQTKWYSSHANTYGVPLDSRNTLTSTTWQMFAAATVTDDAVRDLLVSSVLKYAAAGNTSQPLGDWYDTIASTLSKTNRAEGAVGGHLALVWTACQPVSAYPF
ncbi:DUF1793-domain-containing protein [Trametes versicolor FP-101664 SS1]|uniref:DUF1793-domain-containing protein n=1 Tax=Trametes versicolor (strain FP-101664) TaxID=717944 RepID=UPI000462415E|nr:DUF1793-domain-containing protein [Trametes versicolor FP-101664 SS1]EIW62031.1 DUF1793-domain-containing protein [Trametes versicolor FP-101664 SS1]